MAEQTGTDPAIYYLHGLDLVAQSDGAATEYFLYDGLGSVRQVADETGNVLLAQTYDPYGSVYTSVGVDASSYGFTGEQVDANGLVYLRARYYQPRQGRFFQLDPSRQEVNLYQYSYSNPLNYADPTGLCADPNAENYDGVAERYGGSTCRYGRGGVVYTDLWNSDWYGGCQKCHASNAYFASTGSAYLYSDELALYSQSYRSNLLIGALTCAAAGTAAAGYSACGLNPLVCTAVLEATGETAYWVGMAYNTTLIMRDATGVLPPSSAEFEAAVFGTMAGYEMVRMQWLGSIINRQSSLRNIYQEFERLGVTVDSTDEAVRYLDWIESAHNVSVSAATLGDDYIAIRPEVRGNARILLEELIHVHQSRLGMVTTSNSVELEIVARYVILENRHLWRIASSEADMLYQEIMYMVETGSY